ncbi:MAG: rhodanese-like domain-containing protein [Bacteroidota bacterium]|nr:rhodanese-like domain-containing protein [Bacteroidota bacterium]
MNCFRKCFLAAFATVIAFLITGCSGESESGTPGILVSTEWLQNQRNDPDLVLLHSGTAELFDSLHIPGARLIIPASITVYADSVRNELPHPDSILTLLRSVGVNNESRIVLYHETSRLLTRTTRVYVTLDHVGLGNQTFVLNGGLPAWQEEDRETTSMSPEFSYGNLDVPDVKEVIIRAAELDRQRWSPELVVIDTRSDEEYFGTPGTEEAPAKGGHIEGAYFLPYQDLLLDDRPYLFKPDPELEKLFRNAGMDPKKNTVLYCGSGIRATASYVAAKHLGYPALLYDGSYEDWRRLDLPLTGPVAIPDTIE